MAWGTPTNLGTDADTSSNPTLLISIGGSTIPAGTLMIVVVSEEQASAPGTVTDTAGNAYSLAQTANVALTAVSSQLQIFYSLMTSPLSGIGNVVYTKNSSSHVVEVSAFYVTGSTAPSPLDLVTALVTGTAVSGGAVQPSITSAAPGEAGELFLGVLFWDVVSVTFGNPGGWSSPPPVAVGGSGGTNVNVAGAYQINAGASALTYNPGLTSGLGNAKWAALLLSFAVAPPPVRGSFGIVVG